MNPTSNAVVLLQHLHPLWMVWLKQGLNLVLELPFDLLVAPLLPSSFSCLLRQQVSSTSFAANSDMTRHLSSRLYFPRSKTTQNRGYKRWERFVSRPGWEIGLFMMMVVETDFVLRGMKKKMRDRENGREEEEDTRGKRWESWRNPTFHLLHFGPLDLV